MPFWLLIQAGIRTSGARMISPPWARPSSASMASAASVNRRTVVQPGRWMSAKKARVELNEPRATSSTANASAVASTSVVSSERTILTDGFESQA